MTTAGSSRVPLALLCVVLACGAVVALLGGTAAALPGDAPIAILSPPNGATVPATSLGIPVTFRCPSYRREAGMDSEPDVLGDAGDYGVRFSTSPALGADGRLGTSGFGDTFGDAFANPGPDKVTCGAELELPNSPVPAALFQGRVFWQPYRVCENCATEFEVGAISSFVVVPNVEGAELTLQAHTYAGYLSQVSFSSFSELNGAEIVLQDWDGKAWTELSRQPASPSGETRFFVKQPAGPGQLRALVVAAGTSLALEGKRLTVRKVAGRRSVTTADAGRYVVANGMERREIPLSFEIAEGGKALRHLKATVPVLCFGATPAQDVRLMAKVGLPSARIAPDGTIVGRTRTKGETPAYVTLSGNLHDRRFSGELTTAFSNCVGGREIDAVPAKAQGRRVKR